MKRYKSEPHNRKEMFGDTLTPTPIFVFTVAVHRPQVLRNVIEFRAPLPPPIVLRAQDLRRGFEAHKIQAEVYLKRKVRWALFCVVWGGAMGSAYISRETPGKLEGS